MKRDFPVDPERNALTARTRTVPLPDTDPVALFGLALRFAGWSVVSTAAFLLAAGLANAEGIGASFSLSHGAAELEDRDDVWEDLDTRTTNTGLGLVFDSNLAQDRPVNYRLNMGIEFTSQEVEQAGIHNEVQGTNFVLDQTLGFGFIRTPDLRVFIGPSLHLGVGRIDDQIDVDGFRVDYEETSFTAGFGPEVGFNFHAGRNLTFSTSLFARYGVRVQSFDDFYDEAGSDGDFVGDELRAGIVTSIFFRFGKDEGY
jgi:hypothetical protein